LDVKMLTALLWLVRSKVYIEADIVLCRTIASYYIL